MENSYPTSFAIIEPGSPFPKVVLSSGSETSELVGFYSLRQLGLGDLRDTEKRFFSLTSLLEPRGKGGHRGTFCSFDVWISDGADGREKEYSLIYFGEFDRLSSIDKSDFEKAIERQIIEAVDARKTNNNPSLENCRNVISAVLRMMDTKNRRRVARARLAAIFAGFFLMLYITALVAVFSLRLV